MKLRSLGLALALIVCLQTAANADDIVAKAEKYGPPAPASSIMLKPPIGADVPPISMLAKKTGYSLAALTLLFLIATGTIKRFSTRRGGTNSTHIIEVVARKNLGPRQALLVVSLNGRKFFLAQGTDNVSLISELSDEHAFDDELDDSFEILEEAKAANFKS